MSKDPKPTVNRSLIKQSCFGTYVLSAKSFKSYLLTQTAYDVVKMIDGKRTVADLAALIEELHKLDPDVARKRVNSVIDELQRLSALRLE